jgi:predicted nuclease of predicted toxin-antitoxin system
LFDEMVSARAARALKELGLRVEHIGAEDHPAKSTPDEQVLEHAKQHKQVIVTTNHDMIELCAEAQKSVAWFDTYGRKIDLAKMVVRIFSQVSDWDDLLDGGPVCVHSLGTKVAPMPLLEASRRARNRINPVEAKRRRAQKAGPTPGDRLDL